MGEESKPSPHLGFAENFGLSGAAAIISKTAAAPIERVKLLVQNQGEMIKAGRLDKPYTGVIDCTMRTFRTEGLFFAVNDRHSADEILSDQMTFMTLM